MSIQIVDSTVPVYDISGKPGSYSVTSLIPPKKVLGSAATLEAACAMAGKAQDAYNLRSKGGTSAY